MHRGSQLCRILPRARPASGALIGLSLAHTSCSCRATTEPIMALGP